MDLLIPVVVAVLGSSVLTALVQGWVNRRKTAAEADKTAAEADETVVDAAGAVVQMLRSEVERLGVRVELVERNHEDCQRDLTLAQDHALKAEIDAQRARVIVVELQDRLDRIEASQDFVVSQLDAEIARRGKDKPDGG